MSERAENGRAQMGDALLRLIDGLPAMVGYWDRDLRNRLANSAYVDFFGVDPEDLRGKHIRDLLGPELYERNHPFMERALRGEAQQFDREIETPTGPRYTQASYIPDVRADGRVDGFFVLVTDISERRRAEIALAAARERLSRLIEDAPDAMVVVGQEGSIRLVNAQAERLFGYDRDELLGMAVDELLPERYREDHDTHRSRYFTAPSTRMMGSGLELWCRRRDGTEVPVEISLAPMEGDDGPVTAASLRDVSERYAAEAVNRRLAAIVENSNDAILAKTPEGIITDWNRAAERLFGYAAEEMIGGRIAPILPSERKGEEADLLRRVLNGERIERFETERLRKDGSRVDVALTVSPIKDAAGRIVAASTFAHDISERKRFERQLQYLADHDNLTGLYNRSRFESELEHEVARARRHDGPGALLVIDVDNFKAVNDTYGHAVGDLVLKGTADVLRRRLRSSDVIGRLGGDEFAVIVPECGDGEAMTVATALVEAIREEHHGRFGPTEVTASVGVAVFGAGDTLTMAEIVVRADMAMYDAKAAGRDRAALYGPGTRRPAG